MPKVNSVEREPRMLEREIGFCLPLPPRTKKTHNQIVRVRGRAIVMPSKQFTEWNKLAQMWLAVARKRFSDELPIASKVNCRALFYRDAERGDATGYYQALADALQEGGIVENDRLIVSWDGSRLRKDSASPRIEVILTEASN